MGNSVALAGSANLQQVLNDLDARRHLGFAEFQVLRDAADARLDAVIRRYPQVTELAQFEAAAREVAQSMQISCLMLRSTRIDPVEAQQVRTALEYRLAYLQACLQRSLEHFPAA